MDPLLHFLSLQMSRTFVDSPEVARRRETLRERDREARSRQAQRPRECVRQAVALLTARRWRDGWGQRLLPEVERYLVFFAVARGEAAAAGAVAAAQHP